MAEYEHPLEEKDIPDFNKKIKTIKGLRLDIESAMNGKTWLLLPHGFRNWECGKTYPLPTRRSQLQKLAAITVPTYERKRDCGCIYIRRAITKWKDCQRRTNSAILDAGLRAESIARKDQNLTAYVKEQRSRIKEHINNVKEDCVKAVASLNDLFAIGRKGIEGQMNAHVNDEPWKGEKIDARAFRECFRIVTTAVKGLGLPSDQKGPAADAVVNEVAAAIRATQETQALAPTAEDISTETEH